MRDYDVIIVGGGHAGCEAARASAATGAKTALMTQSMESIGVMSCNPAIGGLGKGHLVREVDAMGGLMGRVSDVSGIQFRLLNRRKGAAVHGPRTQADRRLYREAMQMAMKAVDGLDIVEAEAGAFRFDTSGNLDGLISVDGRHWSCRSVVITTGTFLRGVIHIGDHQIPAGRVGEAPSLSLAKAFDRLALPLARLKTGTPPRLDVRSIDMTGLDYIYPDDEPVPFSFLTRSIQTPQIPCAITRTNSKTHRIISENIGRSAMHAGNISGIGPRYCPSIEDKITRFGERDGHQIVLEPEGLDDNTIYPNGISTSLPADVQEEMIRSIGGLKDVTILQHGYAIEYDHVDPRALDHGLSVKTVPGLFLAGQINGTTGYEEAAAQGLVAGLNAARFSGGQDAAVLSRTNSYIGVMIDDLVGRGVTEPYRMFTSRAEYRLSLRIDNADRRLTPIAQELGLIDGERWLAYQEKSESMAALEEILRAARFTPQEANAAGLSVNLDGKRRSVWDLLSYPDISMDAVKARVPQLDGFSRGIQKSVEIDAQYSVYVERQAADIAMVQKEEALEIPGHFDYSVLPGLSNELKQKLAVVKPSNIAQARSVDGMTPAALALLVGALKYRDKKGRRRVGVS